MKRILLFIMTFVIAASLWACESEDEGENERKSESEEVDKEDEEYIAVRDVDDLEDIENDMDGKYRLMNDIDMSNCKNWKPIGAGSGEYFTGVLDGNGYSIVNINIEVNADEEEAYAGLFKQTSGATFKNLGIEGGTINITSSKNIQICCGAFAAKAYAGKDGSNTQVINCFNTAEVSTTVVIADDNSMKCWSEVGAFFGYGYADFTNCYNVGTITAALNAYSDSEIGGFIGSTVIHEKSKINIESCYNAGEIKYKYLSGGTKVGKILGNKSDSNRERMTLKNVYYVSEYSSDELNDRPTLENAVQGIKDSEFENVYAISYEDSSYKEKYEGFDFDNIWAISDNVNNGYPYLKSQKNVETSDNMGSSDNQEDDEKIVEIDPFKGVSYEVTGISPFCEVIINNQDSDEAVQQYVTYTFDKEYYANNEEVVVTAVLVEDTGDVEYKLKKSEDRYEVHNQPEYITSTEGIDLSFLKQELEDSILAEKAKMNGSKLFTVDRYDLDIYEFCECSNVNMKESYISVLKLIKYEDYIKGEQAFNRLTFLYEVNVLVKEGYGEDKVGKTFWININAYNVIKYPDGTVKWGTDSSDDYDFYYNHSVKGLEDCVLTNLMCDSDYYNISKVKLWQE